MAAAAESPGRAGSPDWARKYPPLLSIFVALLLALVVMPSALNLPQTNPTQTLEYAPVPPSDDEPPPPMGNLSQLGLGSSSAVEVGGALGGNDEVSPPVGKGVTPSGKRCVGSPPRQTEDPISPPCVAYFAGDNFGTTYQGVTREEVKLLIYIDSGYNDVEGSKGSEIRPENEYYDLFQPKDSRGEHVIVTALRGWQRYFNDRFQTYGRAVHFIVYFSSRDKTPESRRADAADNYSKVRPFAVLTYSAENEIDYVEAMAKKGVLNFGTFTGRSFSFFQKYPKLIWGFDPALEISADNFGSFLCTKVVNQPVVMSGNPGENGGERKLGYWHTDDENFPGLVYLADMVKKEVEACGGTFEAEGTFPRCCFTQDNSTSPDYAATQMAEFKQRGITTIIWPAGAEGNVGKAATAIGYYPEWVLLGDGFIDGNETVAQSQQAAIFDKHAVIMTPTVVTPPRNQSRCWQAYREADRQMADADMRITCRYYRNLFQFFTGIQVAGPRLGPTSVDKGYHAIPPVRSNDPTTPACFYRANDYSCVKDGQVEWYDASGQAEGERRAGCWRSMEAGRRYLDGQWPKGNINAQITPSDRCNGHQGGYLIDPA